MRREVSLAPPLKNDRCARCFPGSEDDDDERGLTLVTRSERGCVAIEYTAHGRTGHCSPAAHAYTYPYRGETPVGADHANPMEANLHEIISKIDSAMAELGVCWDTSGVSARFAHKSVCRVCLYVGRRTSTTTTPSQQS